MRSRGRWLGLLLLAGLTSSALAAAVVSAALQPGIPVEAAAGVPGHGRTWELVTPEEVTTGYPVSSNGGSITPGYVSRSAERVVFMTLGKLPDAPEQQNLFTENYATRGQGGWIDSWLPNANVEKNLTLEAVSSDLGETLWNGYLPDGSAALTLSSLDGTSSTLVSVSGSGEYATFIGAAEDLGRVFFASNAHLLPPDADRTAGTSLYEADRSGLHLVDVDDGGRLLSDCGSTASRQEEAEVSAPRTVSADGSRVFFTTNPDCTGPAEVFMREGGERTVEISASQCDLADCGPEAGAEYLGATPSGSSVYLRTTQRLTDDDTDSAASLYRYDVASGKLTLLTPSSAQLESPHEVTPSSNGSRTYFVAGKEGSEGLFLADETGLHEVSPSIAASPLQISASGRYLAFVTTTALDPRDTDASADVYRYDVETGKSTLVSTGPAGGNGSFPARFFDAERGVLRLPPNQPATAMSEDGSEVFFGTKEALLPEDRNEVEDVYEWDEGGLSLVSSGAGDKRSTFRGTVGNGSTAFFETTETLIPRDRDGGEMDIYAARVGSGFPEPTNSECQGTCRGPASVAPARPAAKSAKVRKRIVVGKVDTASLKRMAASGWIELLLEAPRKGRLSVRATAKVAGHARTVAATTVKVAAPGPLQLRMHLSATARARLAAGHGMKLKVALRLGHLAGAVRLDLGGRR